MKFVFILVIAFLLGVELEARTWRSVDGAKSFEATYLSHDEKMITLRQGTRILTFEIAKLHAADQEWLKEKEAGAGAVDSGGGQARNAPAPKGAAFDTLVFGDTRTEVMKKLEESPAIEAAVAQAMLARIGLNGAFRTKETIGGLHCYLYFDWDRNQLLKEVTLRTPPQAGDTYQNRLKENWQELIKLLTILHGNPLQSAPYPSSQDLQDGLFLGSHLWRTEDGHSVLLGTGQEQQKFLVFVRLTSDQIQTNPVQ